MAASKQTVDAIISAIRNSVGDEKLKEIISELLDIPGNASFRNTIEMIARRAGVNTGKKQ